MTLLLMGFVSATRRILNAIERKVLYVFIATISTCLARLFSLLAGSACQSTFSKLCESDSVKSYRVILAATRRDMIGMPGITNLQKFTVVTHKLVYDTVADSIDEYRCMGMFTPI